MTRVLACVCGGLVVLLVFMGATAAGVVAAVFGGGGGASIGCLPTVTVTGEAPATAAPACPSGGAAVLARAGSWLTAWHGRPVPYLSSGNPGTWFRGYRRDCSGFASMALGLPGPGWDTAQLAHRSTRITKGELVAGDLLINPAPNLRGHVVIFDHWAYPTMTAYVGYEQSGDGGTHHRMIPYPYFGGYPMSPYRYGLT